ncbi:hypothetical protein DRN98_08825 [Methanosarcinales archaeon]|nr:MAG: hypothetical protein DRN98_08825 [Methanosarcinales archaeon]
MFLNWFYIDDPRKGETADPKTVNDLEDFYKRIDLKGKMMQLCTDAMVFGNGYLELEAEKNIQDPKKHLLPSNGIKDVHIVDPLMVKEEIERINYNEFFYLLKSRTGTITKVHNSRIIHLPWIKLGTMRFGKGVIDVAIRSTLAKLGMDWAVGEVIYRHGKPFLVLTTKQATTKELKKSYEILKNITPRTHFAGTDRHDFKMLNPSVVDPEPFAKYYYMNLAAACEMPQMEFLGVQSGQLTGSQVDKASWHQTLRSKQETKFSRIIHTINNYYLKGNWKYEIFWNDIFVDDKAKAELQKIQAEMIKILYYDSSLLTDKEARQLCRDIGLPFPEDDSEFSGESPQPETPEAPEFPTQDDKDRYEFLKEQIKFWSERNENNKMS